MSVDVEEWFQVENLKPSIPENRWDSMEQRLQTYVLRILDIFAETSTKATFFCLGWVAKRNQMLIKKITRMGHEIASHGYHHRLIYTQTAKEFRNDVIRAKALLEDITGTHIIGYRAPSFSITKQALTILQETGHIYDSSYFPVSTHDRYSRFDFYPLVDTSRLHPFIWPPAALPLKNGLYELPITTYSFLKYRVGCGGGGYFRLYPPQLFHRMFRAAFRKNGGAVFYIHPWELDAEQPRIRNINSLSFFRHYVNLHKTQTRLKQLCQRLPFTTAKQALQLSPS